MKRRDYERELRLLEIELVKLQYWLHVSDAEQERRFQQRSQDPRRRWKFSDIDIEGRNKSVEYLKARDVMFARTDTEWAPWYVVDADVRRTARLDCIRRLLSLFQYEDLTPGPVEMPVRPPPIGYAPTPMSELTVVPQVYDGPGGA